MRREKAVPALRSTTYLRDSPQSHAALPRPALHANHGRAPPPASRTHPGTRRAAAAVAAAASAGARGDRRRRAGDRLHASLPGLAAPGREGAAALPEPGEPGRAAARGPELRFRRLPVPCPGPVAGARAVPHVAEPAAVRRAGMGAVAAVPGDGAGIGGTAAAGLRVGPRARRGAGGADASVLRGVHRPEHAAAGGHGARHPRSAR